MKKLDHEPSFEGMLEVYQLVMDGMKYFCRKFDLSRSQADIIMAICANGESTLKELCDYSDFPKSTASRIVDELVERKMLERTVPPENRRVIKISVNKKFWNKMQQLNEGPELNQALTQRLSQEEGMREIGKLMIQRNSYKEKAEKKQE